MASHPKNYLFNFSAIMGVLTSGICTCSTHSLVGNVSRASPNPKLPGSNQVTGLFAGLGENPIFLVDARISGLITGLNRMFLVRIMNCLKTKRLIKKIKSWYKMFYVLFRKLRVDANIS